MLVVPCEGRDLLDLGSGEIPGIDSTDTSSLHVNFEHDLRGSFSVQRKKPLEHENHEFHGRKVIVE